MTNTQYIEQRTSLLDKAQEALDMNKVEDAARIRADIEALDRAFEEASTEEANLRALAGSPVVVPQVINNAITSAEDSKSNYKTAFFKALMGKEMTQEEKLAYTSASSSAGAAIPEETLEEIISKLKETAPLLNEITLLQVAGNVKFAVEASTADASKHTENANISADGDALVSVSLGGYEIVKLIQVSDTVATMSINAFEGWLVDMLVAKIGEAVQNYIISGTGSNQPKGVEKANSWDATNSVTVGKSADLASKDVMALIGLLGGGYDANAKFLMSKRTLFSDFMPLKDDSKNDIVTREGRDYFIFGYPVLIDSAVTEHEAYLGDFSKIVGNLAEAIQVKTGFDIDTNSNKYLGVAIFDCQPAYGEAFVKLAKATA